MKRIRLRISKRIYINLSFLFEIITLGTILFSKSYELLLSAKGIIGSFLIGLLIGYIMIATSLLVNFKLNVYAFTGLLSILDFFEFIRKEYMLMIKYFYVALIEELFWRGAIQRYCFNSFLLLMLLNAIFTALHFIFKRKVYMFSVVEFYVFFLILALVFFFTGNIYIVIAAHMVRNINICYAQSHRRGDYLSDYS